MKASVIYHLPGSDFINYLEGNIIPFTGKEYGFLIAPFSKDGVAYIILPEIEKQYSMQETFEIGIFNFHSSFGNNIPTSVTKEKYIDLVRDCVNTIEKEEMKKAVLSRCAIMPLPNSFNEIAFFQRITKTYPSAFSYLLNTPEFGTWLGATPELLVEQKGDIIRTMALAGTIVSTLNSSPFTAKETNEQSLVTDYIKEIFDNFCTAIKISLPGIRQAGNIQHIVTFFEGHLKDKTKAIQLAQSLHPTPAVCGLPSEKAYQYIIQNEGYERSLYSGFLGSIKEDAISLYVNLRCMQIVRHDAILYAGAGIVIGSIPDKEWEETENKMDTLRNLL